MIAFPKHPRQENPHLRLMMRYPGQNCLLLVPRVCVDNGRTCGCHGNSSSFNKGKGLKAHDFFMVRGCDRCHTWLDSSYSASGQERQEAFLTGLWRQIAEYRFLLEQSDLPAKDRAAVEWALQGLKEHGYV